MYSPFTTAALLFGASTTLKPAMPPLAHALLAPVTQSRRTVRMREEHAGEVSRWAGRMSAAQQLVALRAFRSVNKQMVHRCFIALANNQQFNSIAEFVGYACMIKVTRRKQDRSATIANDIGRFIRLQARTDRHKEKARIVCAPDEFEISRMIFKPYRNPVTCLETART